MSVKNLHKFGTLVCYQLQWLRLPTAACIFDSALATGFPVLHRNFTRLHHNGFYVWMDWWMDCHGCKYQKIRFPVLDWPPAPTNEWMDGLVEWMIKEAPGRCHKDVFSLRYLTSYFCFRSWELKDGRLLQHCVPRGGYTWQSFSVVHQVSIPIGFQQNLKLRIFCDVSFELGNTWILEWYAIFCGFLSFLEGSSLKEVPSVCPKSQMGLHGSQDSDQPFAGALDLVFIIGTVVNLLLIKPLDFALHCCCYCQSMLA